MQVVAMRPDHLKQLLGEPGLAQVSPVGQTSATDNPSWLSEGKWIVGSKNSNGSQARS